MSFFSCFIDAMLSFISLRILLNSFTFLRLFFFFQFLHFLSFLYVPFVAIVSLGSIFHDRSFYQKAGILGHHSHFKTEAIKSGWKLCVLEVIDVIVRWFQRSLTDNICRSLLLGSFCPPLSCLWDTNLDEDVFEVKLRKEPEALFLRCVLLLNPSVESIPP